MTRGGRGNEGSGSVCGAAVRVHVPCIGRAATCLALPVLAHGPRFGYQTTEAGSHRLAADVDLPQRSTAFRRDVYGRTLTVGVNGPFRYSLEARMATKLPALFFEV